MYAILIDQLLSPAPRSPSSPPGEKLAPYYPTPETIVERMLDLGQLKAGEKMFDLGSGDGRIVIMAAQQYHADATGVELDADLVDIQHRRRSASWVCRKPPTSSTATS